VSLNSQQLADLFNVSELEIKNHKLDYLLFRIKEILPKKFQRIDTEAHLLFWSSQKTFWQDRLLTCREEDEWLVIDNMNEAISELKKFSNKKKYRNTPNNLNIDRAKEYPIKNILELFGVVIHNNRKFKLRNEDTPSCWIYENKNDWHDFGDDTHGDSIDLYQRLANCSFQEAVKYLST